MQRREPSDNVGNQIGVDGLHHADGQGAALQPFLFSNGHLRQFHFTQGTPGMFPKNRSGPGQLDRSPNPVEERHADFLLQLFDLGGQGRLRDREPFGRFGKMQRVGHREKVPEMTEFHTTSYHN